MGLREQILGAVDTIFKTVDVVEWGCQLWLKTWSGAERAQVQALHKDASNDMISRVVALSAVDEHCVRVFSDADVKALSEKNGSVLERIALAALEHNGVGKEAEAKNS